MANMKKVAMPKMPKAKVVKAPAMPRGTGSAKRQKMPIVNKKRGY